MSVLRVFSSAAAIAAAFAALTSAPADARARGQKRDRVTEIIVHATGGPFCQRGEVRFSPPGTAVRIKRFFEKSSSVSIHYIVERDGEVLASVPEDEVAIHAVGHNANSIGIELINAGDGRDPYPAAQVRALGHLIGEIRWRHGIALSQVKGHEQVDRSTIPCGGRQVHRKQDPGPLFPWDKLKLELILAEAGAAKRR
ncbi:MAG: N-acetylmuramoyl-L-alanine amidase [Hyphomicrobiaceae bacterium]